jgi:hypothetical protein
MTKLDYESRDRPLRNQAGADPRKFAIVCGMVLLALVIFAMCVFAWMLSRIGMPEMH